MHTDTNEMMANMLHWPAGLPFPMQQMIWCFHRVCLTSAWCSMQVTVASCISLSALSHEALLLLILRVMDLNKPLTLNIKLWHVTCLVCVMDIKDALNFVDCWGRVCYYCLLKHIVFAIFKGSITCILLGEGNSLMHCDKVRGKLFAEARKMTILVHSVT